jgi:hypothetical protein
MAMTTMAFFIYAIIGMHLFAGVRSTGIYYINDDANFESFATAMITLIRCSTGENWYVVRAGAAAANIYTRNSQFPLLSRELLAAGTA